MTQIKKRARLSDTELAFYENNTAAALSIVQDAKALLYWTDDPDAIRLISLILEQANYIRQSHIDRSEQRKEETKNGNEPT